MVKRNLIVNRFRVLSGIAIVLATPFVTHAANAYARAVRLNPNAIGGEILVPVLLLVIAVLIIPQEYMTIKVNDSKYYPAVETTMIDMSYYIESSNKVITSESGLFEIIDGSSNSHIIKLTAVEEE